MKKLLSLLVCFGLCLTIGGVVGCGNKDTKKTEVKVEKTETKTETKPKNEP